MRHYGQAGVESALSRFKVTIDSNHSEALSPNSLDRQFDVVAPNQVWTTDITYVWTLEGRLYLAVVMDFFSRQVLGGSIADPMRTPLCVGALQMAFCPKGTSVVGNQNRVCPTTRVGAANRPAMNTVSACPS